MVEATLEFLQCVDTDIDSSCWYVHFRHHVSGDRPAFRELVIALTGTKDKVLSIPQEALDTHQVAGVLGAPLEAGQKLYTDLQNRYSDTNPDNDDNQECN